MKESTTYQAILEEGREEGRKDGVREGLLTGRRDTLLAILRDRFPDVSDAVKARIECMDDPEGLQSTILRALHVDRIEDLTL
jgi:predicted transposase YdaD